VALVPQRYRRERSLEGFTGTFKDQNDVLDGVNPLEIEFPGLRWFPLGKSFQARKFVKAVDRVIAGSDPRRLHFLLPMTGQHATYEFLKGVLKVLSPEAELPVTAVKVPSRARLNLLEKGVIHETLADTEKAFQQALDAALKKHGSTKEGTRFVVIDHYGSGTTERAFVKQLGGNCVFLWDDGFSQGRVSEYHMTKDKSWDGRVNISRGDLLDMILLQDPASPPETRRGPDDFLYKGRFLFDALDKTASRYFTMDEIGKIHWKEAFDNPAGSHTTKKWPPIIDHIREMPEQRRREIVAKLKKDDAMLARMAYQYGIAQAKEYIQHKQGRLKPPE
jgi:hypothetical protein